MSLSQVCQRSGSVSPLSLSLCTLSVAKHLDHRMCMCSILRHGWLLICKEQLWKAVSLHCLRNASMGPRHILLIYNVRVLYIHCVPCSCHIVNRLSACLCSLFVQPVNSLVHVYRWCTYMVVVCCISAARTSECTRVWNRLWSCCFACVFCRVQTANCVTGKQSVLFAGSAPRKPFHLCQQAKLKSSTEVSVWQQHET